MKVILDITDNMAVHLLKVLKSLPYVKTKMTSNEKALLIEEITEAVDMINFLKVGKLKARSAKDLIKVL